MGVYMNFLGISYKLPPVKLIATDKLMTIFVNLARLLATSLLANLQRFSD